MAHPLRRKKGIVSRRRIEDEEGEEHHLEDDSLSEASASDEDDAASVGGRSHTGTESPQTSKKIGNGHSKSGRSLSFAAREAERAKLNGAVDTELMQNGAKVEECDNTSVANFDEVNGAAGADKALPIVSSTAIMDQPLETPIERRRREHEDYKKQRDENPAFVPNRGAFFMHDHRHAGPAANGFRPFNRGRGRGGRGGGPFGQPNFMHQLAEPTDSQWTHDMHDVVARDDRSVRSQSRQGRFNNPSRQALPQAPKGPAPNRELSSTKLLGNVQIRIYLPNMEKPLSMPPLAIHQYTRLPDHRPPLRRDKPVRISLPDIPPRYIFPATERSFIFIPRAMRPNQQGFGSRSNRGRGLGSVGGFSRRTSVYGGGGSMYGGSVYSPSVAMSRRSSVAHHDFNGPAGSIISRPNIPMDSGAPVVRLPPTMGQTQQQQQSYGAQQRSDSVASMQRVPQPYPMPQNPTFRENRPNPIPMQHPRPQKAVSLNQIESPAALQYNAPQQYQQPFSHQIPPQVNGQGFGGHLMSPHSRQASYQGSTGTPLSQIPERAIHAQPFQPHAYQQPMQEYYPQQYPMMPQQQQPYYYPGQYGPQMPSPAPAFAGPAMPQPVAYGPPTPANNASQNLQAGLVAQEVNGMVYYYDAAQIPAVATFPAFASPPQPYPVQQLAAPGMTPSMVSPSPDGFYYPQSQPGMMYYPQ